jgi:ribosome-binding protein aMBF1 (putative translation factor)
MSDFTDDVLRSEAGFIRAARKPRELRTTREEALLPHARRSDAGSGVVDPERRLDEACGSVIRSERMRRGWSVYVLAERLHASPTFVVTNERGESRLTPPKIARFADALGLKPSVLLRRMSERLEDINE